MRRLGVALGAAALLAPVSALAEPISVSVQSGSGYIQTEVPASGSLSVDLGSYDVSGGAEWYVEVSGLATYTDYNATMSVTGTGWNTLTAEILDPGPDGDDATDSASQAYVPAGYTTSGEEDGFSFAQNSNMERSVVWSSGSGDVTADETTDARDMLTFTGLGTETALMTFGLRDAVGDRTFLIRFATDADPVAAPEPGTMLLVGTVLAGGLGAAVRRRRSA